MGRSTKSLEALVIAKSKKISLAKAAEEVGISRQAVYKFAKERGWGVPDITKGHARRRIERGSILMDDECPSCFGPLEAGEEICRECQADPEIEYCEIHHDWFRGSCQFCDESIG